MRVLGAILAGGASSRFGSDKSAANFQGLSLIDHARNAIARHVAECVIIGPEGVADLPRPGMGPLGGIAGALDHAAARGFDSVLTIACDMPRVPDGLIEALLRRMPAYCVEAPVLGHWPAALGAQVMAHIDGAPDRSTTGWVRSVGALPIEAGAPLANINTREDLLAL
ncbi:MAG TPA: molybdenum cofactor guanylyltransferase [Sphingomonas sp.]|jgi:molybdopterin-guanine dinucleotide biosynthesis protein A|nr:molybdenum cofactor guanylyltransferase [Sphingomonas sp.]